MQIRSKILIPIIALLVVFAGMAGYSRFYYEITKKDLESEIDRIRQINSLSTQMTVIRQQSRLNVLLYLINQDQNYLRTNQHLTINTNALLEQMNPLVKSETGKALLQEFEQSRQQTSTEKDILITAINQTDTQAIEKRFNIWNIHADNNYAILLDFMNYHQRLMEQSQDVYQELLDKILLFQVFTATAMIAFTGAIYLYLNQIITRPLKQLSLLAQDITKGKFKANYHITSTDEIGTLFRNLTLMSKNLEKYQQSLIADVKKKEAELQNLKEFEAQKDSFLSTASHELKTPITSLKIFAQLLKKKISKNNHIQYDSYLKKMDQQVDKVTRLIESLLEVAQMQVGKIPFHFSYFDLNQMIKDEIYLAQKRTTTHRIIVQGKITKKVYADKDRITQVFNNLLSNALKYSPQSQQVIVKIKSSPTHALVSVRDFGIGIEKEQHQKIFKRYYRVSGLNENTFPGLGIGLYINTEIIKQHQGELLVKSRKGKGSIFSFTLPFKPTKPSAPHHTHQPKPSKTTPSFS